MTFHVREGESPGDIRPHHKMVQIEQNDETKVRVDLDEFGRLDIAWKTNNGWCYLTARAGDQVVAALQLPSADPASKWRVHQIRAGGWTSVDMVKTWEVTQPTEHNAEEKC